MPIKIGSKKIKNGESEKKKYIFLSYLYRCLLAPPPLAPPPSPSNDLLSGPNAPALLHAGHPIGKEKGGDKEK